MPHRPRPQQDKPAEKISDLLPIAPMNRQPNAYQVFGLKSGEQDEAEVTAAMQRVYERLKEAKPTAEPEIWKQAAKLAEAARKVLEDPQRRKALDEGLGVGVSPVVSQRAGGDRTADAANADAANAGEANDPLAGLLPTTKPLPASAPGSAPGIGGTSGVPAASGPPGGSSPGGASSNANKASAVLGVPPGVKSNAASSVLGTPPTSESNEGVTIQVADRPAESTKAAQPGVVDWQPPQKKRRRKKNNTGVVLFGLFVVVMLGLIIYLLQFLTEGGRVALTKDGVPAGDGMMVAEPMPSAGATRPDAQGGDGVLGQVPSSGVAESLRGSPDNGSNPTGSGVGDGNPFENQMGTQGMPDRGASMTEPNMPAPPVPDPAPAPPAEPEPEPEPELEPEPMQPTEPSEEMTAEMLQANNQKIAEVEEMIRAADWNQMKSAADGLLKLPLDKEQSARAGSLFDIADLALYYRGAVERGLATLKTGDDFEVVKDFRVLVVEVTADSLSVRFNGKIKTFSFDELPPTLTEKIASFALSPEQPDAIAGQALYRLIHPKTRSEYRDDTFEMLATVDGQLDKVDTAMLQKVARELFAE